MKTYVKVWIVLLTLTVITVETAYQNFGVWNIVIAMGIASVEASLVVLFFMHLKYDQRMNQVVFASAFVFFAIFVGLTAGDELVRPLYNPAKVNVLPPQAQEQTLPEIPVDFIIKRMSE